MWKPDALVHDRATVSGDLVFLGDRYSGVHVIDVADPTAPFRRGSLDTDGWANELHVDGGTLYVSMLETGVVVGDVSDPDDPVIVGSVDTADALGMDFDGDYVYLVHGSSGMTIYPRHCGATTSVASTAPSPPGFLLAPNFPNPFHPATRIPFELHSPGTVELAIYDVAGQRVRSLLEGEALGEGAHRVGWDGRDTAGRSVASGVYFYRLVVGGEQRSGRMTLLR